MTPVQICNQALSWLGANLIISFEDGTPEANLCKANYELLRDAVLEEHPWSFAILRETWPEATPAPSEGHAHIIPDYVIRILGVTIDGSSVWWAVEGNRLISEVARPEVKFIQRVDANMFSPSFGQALAARIAADLALPITNSRTMMESMYALYQRKLDEAANLDGMEGINERIRSTWLLRAR